MLRVEKKALIQVLLGTTLNSALEAQDLKELPTNVIQKILLKNLDPNSEYENTAEQSWSSNVDVGYHTASCDQYSSSFCAKATLPSSSTFCRPALIDGEKKSQYNSISKQPEDEKETFSSTPLSNDKTETCSIVRVRSLDHGKLRVNSNAAVDGAVHFLKLSSEINTPGKQYQLLSENLTPLHTFTNVFDVAKGIEELIRCVVVMKRAKDGQNEYHKYIVGLLCRACAVDKSIRDRIIDKIEKLMTLAADDEEDIWCLSLLIIDLCLNNTTIRFKLVMMLVQLLELTTQSNVEQSESYSTFCFCVLHTVKSILKIFKNNLESLTGKTANSILDQFTRLKNDLVKLVTELKKNHNLYLISYNVQNIVKQTQECIDSIEENAFSLICS